MKREDLFDLLGGADEKEVRNAREYRAQKARPVWVKWAALAACVALVFGAVVGYPLLFSGGSPEVAGNYPPGVTVVSAQTPDPVSAEMDNQQFIESDAHWNWWQVYREKVSESTPLQEDLNGCYSAIMAQLLEAEDENTVASPLNIYIAFSMLAETADGNTRQQILDLLGAPDIETLRQTVRALWQSNYVDTPLVKSLLANSLWLREGDNFNEETLKILAENYLASSFRGQPGSEEMNQALQQWTDANTGGLLKEYTKDLKLDATAVAAIMSTLYYKAIWSNEFYAEDNTQETFHGTKGDADVTMMHRSDTMFVYRTEAFTVVSLGLVDSGSMFFYLPSEGTDVNDLASDPDVLNAVWHDNDPMDEGWAVPLVHLSVPKFKVSAKTDLLDAMKALGLTDALNPGTADFTPLREEGEPLFISAAEHAATVEIDENGVTGAAYTMMAYGEGGVLIEEEIDFVLDRPFLFLVTGMDGSVLFSGIVRNIE
jgi:serine protease inhibitor